MWGSKALAALLSAAFFVAGMGAARADPDDVIRGLLGAAAQAVTNQNQARSGQPAARAASEPVLTRAERGAIQAELNRRGFAVGSPDGLFGRGTRGGIARYQAARGDAATGFLTATQAAELLAPVAAPPSASAPVAEGGFEVLRDSDLPGNDIAMARGTGLDGCRALCAGRGDCAAFTHNTAADVCFLKGAAGAAKPFAGAVSARKIDTAAAALDWRPDDDADSYVARIRAAARAYGGACDAERAAIEAVAADMTLAPFAAEVTARGTLALRWQRQTAYRGVPVYLMVSAEQPVRFQGSGFYALMPGAIAPFGIDTDAGRTRAILALSGSEPQASGEIGIVPLLAGALDLRWSVVGYLRACGEVVAVEQGLAPVRVRTAPEAEFLVNDPFSLETPRRRLVSPAGSHLVEEHAGRFRLVERETGAILIDRSGSEPNFSPGGRFLVVRNDDGFDVFDTVDGWQVARIASDGDVAFENGDSFLVYGGAGAGLLDIRNLLVADRAFGGSTACRICPGTLDVSLRIDLENDVVHAVGRLESWVRTLSGPDRGETGGGPGSDDAPKSAAAGPISAFVAAHTGLAPVYVPEDWSLRGGRAFSHFASARSTDGGGNWDMQFSQLGSFLVAPRVLDDRAGQVVASAAAPANGIGMWRGAAPLIARAAAPASGLAERLGGFGLKLASARPPARDEESDPDAARDGALAREIMAAVPGADGLFAIGVDTYQCTPGMVEGFDEGQILARFDQIRAFDLGARRLWVTHDTCTEGSGAFYASGFHLFDSRTGVVAIDADNPGSNVGTMCYGDLANCPSEVALFADRYLLAWSAEARGMIVVDIDTGGTIFRRFDLPRGDILERAVMSEDLGHVVQINRDGSFYVFDIAGQAQVLEGRYVDDEMVVWAPDLRFDATAEGANYVNLRFPGQRGQFTFEQFRGRLATPGLVETVLAGRLPPRQGDPGVPPRLTASIEAEAGTVRSTIAVDGAFGKGGQVRVFQDGLLTDTLPLTADGTSDIAVARLPGSRWISLVAVDEAGLASLPAGRDLGRAAADLPGVRLLAVGVDAYAGSGLGGLSYAVADANTLAQALATQDGRSIALEDPRILTDGAAAPDAILQAAGAMVAEAVAGETIVFFFAGHGLMGPDKRFYLATSATEMERLEETALSWDALGAVFAQARARVVVVLDACHSGAAGTGLFATNDQAAADVLASVPSGLVVLSASKGRQFSEESSVAGGGLFTNAVADVVARRRDAHDLDGNGVIEVSELYAGVKRLVIEQSRGRQTPWLARNQMVGDFALF